MTKDLDRPVVVGYDGSPSSAAAIEAAAAEAVNLGVPLRIVHAYVWPIFYALLANVPYEPSDWEPPAAVRDELTTAADRLATRRPELDVQSRVMAGTGGTALVAASDHASLVVVGGRGIGGLAGLLAGSVASHVAAHAHCPVMVARGGQAQPATGGRLVVGVDGSSSSLAALRFACDWAERLHADVEAIHAGPHPDRDAEARLADWVESVGHGFPSVQIQPTLTRATPPQALLAASRSATMVVVGSRGRGEIASLVLGSVSHDLVRRSACPVVVVHAAMNQSRHDVDDLVSGKPRGVRRPSVAWVGDSQS